MNDTVDTGPVTPDVLLITLDHDNYIKNVQLKTKSWTLLNPSYLRGEDKKVMV
jgi:hypothetical protein